VPPRPTRAAAAAFAVANWTTPWRPADCRCTKSTLPYRENTSSRGKVRDRLLDRCVRDVHPARLSACKQPMRNVLPINKVLPMLKHHLSCLKITFRWCSALLNGVSLGRQNEPGAAADSQFRSEVVGAAAAACLRPSLPPHLQPARGWTAAACEFKSACCAAWPLQAGSRCIAG
jgi:hypothetical protein